MITSWYHGPDGRFTLDLAHADIAARLAGGEGLLWVDIAADGREEGERVLRDIFGFHALTVDDCYNVLIDPPKVDDYQTYLFVIVHQVHYEPETLRLWTSELDMYIGPRYVVSVHRGVSRAVDETRRRAEARNLVMDRGADYLAHALMDVVVDDFHPVVAEIDDQIAGIEERVIGQPEKEVLQEVLRHKRNIQQLKRSILPQRDVVNRFARGEYSRLIGTDALMYFRDVYDHTLRVETMIDGMRDLADSAVNTYLSSVNNRINEVMKTLAIVTVIFMPLTVITGLYGTNWQDGPGYDWAGGWWAMLAGMGLLAVALVLWFRWRRWI